MYLQKWNDGWKFWIEKNAFDMTWSIPDSAVNVTLPHDMMIEEKARADSPNGGNTGYRDGKNGVYVKSFYAPRKWEEEKILVRFEGVYMNAMVYLNGQLVAKSPSGYSTFYAELGPYLHYGEDNELRVFAKAGAMTNSRWYSGAGIYRDVYLLTSGPVHLGADGVQVQTESADAEYATVRVTSELVNETRLSESLILDLEMTDPEGETKAKEEIPVFLPAGNKTCRSLRMTVPEPKLWSEESPNLYHLRVKIRSERGILDMETIRFGIRTLKLDAVRGLQVNGKTVKLRGACIHQDSGLLGSATYDEAQYREIALLKEAGFNAVRMSHFPMAPAMLRACDELGMYVMDELSDMWDRMKSDFDYGLVFSEWWKKDAKSMVRKDFNHPSVILYSIGNEIPEIGNKGGSVLANEISSYFHRLDGSRYTTAGINGIFATGDKIGEIVRDVTKEDAESGKSVDVNDFMSLMADYWDPMVRHPAVSRRLDRACAALDAAGYNYMTARYEEDSRTHPNRVLVGTETYPPEIARNWKLVKKLPNLIGDFTWTGFDYIGEAGAGITGYYPGDGGFGAQYPAQLSYCGDLDLTGFRRPMSYLREMVFGLRKEPYIAVQDPHHYGEKAFSTPWILSDSVHSWNWKGCEGKPVIVEIYAADEEVALYQDGRLVGRKPCGEAEGYRVLFETVYRPGKLTAVTYRDGHEVYRTSLKTAGPCEQICLKKEKAWSSTGELIYLQVELQDREGNVVTDEDQELKAEVEGAKMRIGSGDPKPSHNYNEGVTKTWNGRAQIILQPDQKDGYIRLEVKSETGMKKAFWENPKEE